MATKTRPKGGLSKLTATMVETLPPGEYTDPATSGLQLRVLAKKVGTSRTWLLRYRWRGEYVRIALGHAPGMPLSEARAAALELRTAMDRGIDPRRARPRRRQVTVTKDLSAAAAVPDKHSIDFLVQEFIERHLRPTRKRPDLAEAILNKDVLPAWKGRDARTIEPHEVIELLDDIVGRGAPVAANRTASLLSQMFRFGIHRQIVKQSPVQLLYRPGGKEKPRERALSTDELKLFLKHHRDACRSPRTAHAMMVLLLTAQRRGELALAKWSEIDLKARTWSIPDENSKSGRGHVCPLTDWAVEEFNALKKIAGRSRHVMAADDGPGSIAPQILTRSVRRSQRKFKEFGIEEFTAHDLRRTCRTGLSALKIEPHIAERVLNHVQEKIVGTYDRYAYLDEKRAALEKWEAHLKSLEKAT